MMMRLFAFPVQFALASVLFGGCLAVAQTDAVPARIVAPVDESAVTTLHGSVSGAAQSQFDQGEVPGSTELTHMRVVLGRSEDQQAALDKFESEVQDKASPNYHKWLTPDQFGKLYGPADADIAAIVAWLESHGFTVESVAPGRTTIAFSGTASQVKESFHTAIHSFDNSIEQFFSNNAEPTIPAALATVVQGIAHLNTIHPKPQSVRGKPGTMNAETHRLEPSTAPANGQASPGYTGGTGYLYLVPSDAATIYDTPNTTFNSNYTTGTSYDGTGVTIGIGGDATISTAPIQTYRSKFLGDTKAPTITNVDQVTSTADSGEAYIDTELSGGLAPGATIHFYTATDLNTAIDTAITENTVDIFSLSFLECEQDLSTADNQAINGYWQQAAAQGIAVMVATGDSGSANCDYPTSNGGDVPAATGGLKVSGYASSPYDLAVGGTDFYALTNSFSKYVSSTQNKYYGTSLGYIPESVWNDSTQNNTTFNLNVPPSFDPPNIIAGAGGVSRCSTNTTKTLVGKCTSGYSKPSWQRGAGVPGDGLRDLPDVSLMSGNGFDDGLWLVCDDTSNCVTSGGSFSFDGYGGTSTAAPAFAGIMALVEQSTGGRLGQVATQLYNLYNSSYGSKVFHDVKQGNNSVACTNGTPNCIKNSKGYYYESGYNATTGYDLATGLGSVDATQLLNDWSLATAGATATVTITPNLTTITNAQSLSLAVTVAGSGGLATPTGTVTLSGGGYTSTAEPLASGAYTFVIPAGSLTVGTDTFTITYGGDSNYASTTGTTSVVVTAAAPTLTVTPATATIAVNQTLSVTATATGTGATPTGTFTLVAGTYTSPAEKLSSKGAYTFTVPANSLAVGTGTLTLTYSGDTNYASSTSTATVTVTAGVLATPTVTVTPASTSIAANQTLNVTTAVAGVTGSPVPTGTVTLVAGTYTSPAGTLSSQGGATFAIPAGSLAVGTGAITVSYSGDTNYSPATKGATVTVTAVILPTPAVTVNPSASTLSANQSLTVATTVAGSSGTPTGTVTLSGGGYTSATQTLASGASSFTIPAGSLSVGTDTLTVSYSGDATYTSASNTAAVTVTAAPVPTFTLAATSPAAIAPGAAATSTVTATGSGGYTGAIALSCTLTSSPAGAIEPPACSIPSPTVTLNSTTTTGTSAVSVSTTAPTTSSLLPGPFDRSGWFKTAGGTVAVAFLLFFVPGRTRKLRKVLSAFMLVAAVAFAGIGCGGTTTTGGIGPIKSTPTVGVKPANSSIAVNSSDAVAVAVAGSGTATPTGTVTLSSGTYTSGAIALSSGAASITIPANSLAVGTDTLTATYSGDTSYNSTTGISPLTVTAAVPTGGTTAGTYTFTVTGTGNDAAKTTQTTTFSVVVD